MLEYTESLTLILSQFSLLVGLKLSFVVVVAVVVGQLLLHYFV